MSGDDEAQPARITPEELTRRMVRAFAALPAAEVEARLVRTFALLRRYMGEAQAREVFREYSEIYDLHRLQAESRDAWEHPDPDGDEPWRAG